MTRLPAHRFFGAALPRIGALLWLFLFCVASQAGTSENASATTRHAHAEETHSRAAKKHARKPPPAPYGQDADDYALTFSDEFDRGLDLRLWNDREWYDPRFPTINYAVEDGSLKIWPQKDANGRFFKRVINTDGKFYQTYGYFEIEAKLPIGKGTWPAFWLYNRDDAVLRPEIDIMEAYAGGGPASGWSDAKLRPTAYAVTIWTGEEGVKGGFKMLEDLGDLSAKFHKYALKWEPDRQTFYFDGKQVYSTNVRMPQRMYLLVDLMYGSASGEPDHTTPTGKKNAFEIKYVRAWQFKKMKEHGIRPALRY